MWMGAPPLRPQPSAGVQDSQSPGRQEIPPGTGGVGLAPAAPSVPTLSPGPGRLPWGCGALPTFSSGQAREPLSGGVMLQLLSPTQTGGWRRQPPLATVPAAATAMAF